MNIVQIALLPFVAMITVFGLIYVIRSDDRKEREQIICLLLLNGAMTACWPA